MYKRQELRKKDKLEKSNIEILARIAEEENKQRKENLQRNEEFQKAEELLLRQNAEASVALTEDIKEGVDKKLREEEIQRQEDLKEKQEVTMPPENAQESLIAFDRRVQEQLKSYNKSKKKKRTGKGKKRKRKHVKKRQTGVQRTIQQHQQTKMILTWR